MTTSRRKPGLMLQRLFRFPLSVKNTDQGADTVIGRDDLLQVPSLIQHLFDLFIAILLIMICLMRIKLYYSAFILSVSD